MSDANRTGISYVEEVTWGTNPTTQQRDMGFTGESLAFNIDNITSDTIRTDRQVTDLIQTGASCAGDINFELKYAPEISDFMQGALWDDEWHGVGSPDQGTYTAAVGGGAGELDFALNVAGTIVVGSTHVTNGFNPSIGQSFILTGSSTDDGTLTITDLTIGATITITVAAITTTETLNSGETIQLLIQETLTSRDAAVTNGDFSLNAPGNTITLGSEVTHDIVTGQWIELTGSSTDDGYHYVTNVSGQIITVESITTTEVLELADAATIKGARIRNGTTENSYWIERSHADVTQYFQFAGMVINTWNQTFSANAIATGSFGFIGKAATLTQATSGTGTNASAATTSVMNAVANVGSIRIDGTVVTGCLIQEISFSLNNNVRGLSSIGTLGFCDVGVGEIALTGTLNLYFLDETYYDLFLAGTAFSLSWKVEDSAGNAYIFDLPECKFTTDAVNATGKNSDVMENTGFQAIMDPTLLTTIQVTRVSA